MQTLIQLFITFLGILPFIILALLFVALILWISDGSTRHFILRGSIRGFFMNLLSKQFPYNGSSNLINPATNQPYSVSRPRHFKIVDEDNTRNKFLDFNAQFVRNRIGVPYAKP